MQRSPYIFMVAAFILAPFSIRAASLDWVAPDGGSWSVPANWNLNEAPNSSDDVLRFLTVTPGSVNTNDIPSLHVSSVTIVRSTNVMDFSGNTLTCKTFAVNGFGYGTNALLTLTNGVLVVTNALSIGYEPTTAAGSAQYAVNASMRLSSNSTLQVGLAPDSRANLQISDNRGNLDRQSSAMLVPGGTFNAYLTDLSIAYREGGYSTLDTYGLLDLSSATNKGVLDVAGNVLIGITVRSIGQLIVSDAVDVKIGSSQARGGKIRIASGTPAGFDSYMQLGRGRLDAYVTDVILEMGWCVGSLLATNVSAGILDIGQNLIIGRGVSGVGNGGHLLAGDGLSVKVGSPSNRGGILIGINGTEQQTASFVMGSGSFEASVTNFWIGRNNSNGRTRVFVFDASNVSTGFLNVSDSLSVGDTKNASDGAVTVTLGDRFVTALGSSTNWIPATVGSTLSYSTTFKVRGHFTAYLSELLVATNTATATFNLSGVTNGSIAIRGGLGVGLGNSGVGEVCLPAIPVSAGTVLIGSVSNNSRGTLLMTGTVFTVTNSVLVQGPTTANRGRILTTVNGAPAGLDLTATASLTVNTGIISNTFLNPSNFVPVYWGLRWEGDHTSDLETLRTAGKLGWNTNALTERNLGPVHIFLQDGFTYMGAVMRKRGGCLLVIR